MDPRTALQRLIDEKGEDYSSLSRLIGRNAAYIQQYIKRGNPKKLAEDDRRLLARYFGVSEALLGGPDPAAPAHDVVTVPQLDVGASAGAGAFAGDEQARSRIAFDRKWLRGVSADPKRLSMIRVEGDSMLPTLADGDEILVDGGDASARLRDGIYVLRMDDVLMVKRLAINPAARRVTVKSDNPAYPSWPDCPLTKVDVVGRVVWAGRKVA
jgi:phage repressor protein C with HTH and peptisase S24 domain